MDGHMQTLGAVARLYPSIRNGEKTSTIRWRENIVPGPLRIVNDADPRQSVIVRVLRCTEMPLSQAAAFMGKADDWPDDIMLLGMREHYPDIELSSLVQVIEFEPPVSA